MTNANVKCNAIADTVIGNTIIKENKIDIGE